MSRYENTPPQQYEITWWSGHVETVFAHQVSHGSLRIRVGALSNGEFATESEGQRISFHAEVDGQWTLQLQAPEADIRIVRNVTAGEQLPGSTS
ncbi:hypothetical protein ABZ401_12875 [Streptomyces sp. NPDC005892]|uniref:hypothetical protein n=1 Tax=Streptomyces sp. NPDC005892 TaxID=3155593 RepID=UPI0033FFE3C1